MAVAFDATTGGAAANSYASVSDADDYHARRLFATDWTTAISATKQAALMWATQLLDDNVLWNGAKSTTAQALQWPRCYVVDTRLVSADGTRLEQLDLDSTTVPAFVVRATAEFARQLTVKDLAADNQVANQALQSMSVGGIQISFGRPDPKVIPDAVWAIIRPWCKPRYQGVSTVALERA